MAVGSVGHVRLDMAGLEQFAHRGSANGIGFCIAGPRPYALEFSNDEDVICLLLGDIAAATKFEDDRESPLLFAGNTSAFHPRGGNVRVRAHAVAQGFVAFSYPKAAQATLDDEEIAPVRAAGSQNNVRVPEIDQLANAVLRRLRSREALQPFEIESIGALVYVETIRALRKTTDKRRTLSDREFDTIVSFIDAELGGNLTCARMAEAANVPLRVVFDGMKLRTGMSPHRFVIERRLARAQVLLSTTRDSIADIALACGFSSQQHLTSTFTRRMGTTPRRIQIDG